MADVRISINPASSSLFVLSRRGSLERLLAPHDHRVEWVEHPDDRQVAGLLVRGRVDFAGTGPTPPLHAQADGADLVYIAESAPRPERSLLLVRRDGPVHDLAELAGRRVALSDGSTDTLHLALALQRRGVRLGDLRLVNTVRRTGRAMLARGAVDAWVGRGDELDLLDDGDDLWPLTHSEVVTSSRAAWFATHALAEERPAVLALVLDALADTEDWIDDHRADAAALLAEHVPGDVTADGWRRRLRSRRWGLRPVSTGFLAQQQRAADLLAEHGALSHGVDMSKAVAVNTSKLH